MNRWRFILASLWHYRRTHLTVAAGVAVATAVVTGALLVGDSVRGSLRDLTLERLGDVDSVVLAQRPFREELAEDLKRSASDTSYDLFVSLLLVPGSLSTTDTHSTNATQLSILGVSDAFWQFGPGGPEKPLAADEVAVSPSIAAELHASVGDEVLLRVGVASNLPADSTLGEKQDATRTRRLRIAAIPGDGIARFGLQPSQLEPRNVFVALPTLQRLLETPGKVNAIAVGGDNPHVTDPAEQAKLQSALRPKLADYGLVVDEVTIGAPAVHYVQISSVRLVLPDQLVRIIENTFGQDSCQPLVTYLANTISLGDKQVSYSTVTGINSTAELGPLYDDQEEPLELADDEIVLNDWAAKELGAKVGDHVTLNYYEPETTHGQRVEKSTEPLRLRAIVPLRTAEDKLTTAADQHFTPEMRGVTDEQSINDWDLPFELVEEITSRDEDYWDEYRTTPKAFVSLALAEKLWSSRWGSTSAVRLPVSDRLTAETVAERLESKINPADLGIRLLPVKQQGLAAARGTTAFEGLFLGFSFFLMASAVMLVALLFRLGAESRAAEVGLLAAVGFRSRQLRRVWLGEAAIVALIGAVVGVLGGIAYARLMIHGLTTWWVAATVTPFLKLHVPPISLLGGFACGLVVALMTIAWSLRRLLRLSSRQLLSGDTTDPRDTEVLLRNSKWRWMPLALLAGAAGTSILGSTLRDEAQAGAFFGSGALVLAALVIWLRQRLRQSSAASPRSLTLAGLTLRNARRNPSRTLLSVALAGVASFLIVALSVFRLAPTTGGTGGFQLLATADLPIYFDLNTPEGREQLGFSADEEAALHGTEIVSLRVHQGEDASCLNLYQTTEPQVVAIPPGFDSGRRFAWAADETGKHGADRWQLLDRPLDDGAIPVVLDKSTAVYSLHLSGIGSRLRIRNAFSSPVELEVVGLLSGSVLQGHVLMSEDYFLSMFPDSAGRRLFLTRCPEESSADKIAGVLESQLVDYGYDAVSAPARLAEFLAVQNTYLSTFQSLGALGLLLGTFGLAVAQLRSVVERRGELALLRSTGFRRERLARMVLGENLALLLAGLGCGCVAALVSTLPHWTLGQGTFPSQTLALLLVVVLLSGIAAGWLAVKAALRAPLLPALRGE